MKSVGWLFGRGDDYVWVCVADQKEARKKAVAHLGGEPEGEPQAISADLARFLRLGQGGMATGRVVERGNL